MAKTLLTIDKGIAFLQLNSPENLNALDITMDDELLTQLEKCSENPDVNVVVLSGAGRAFSAGGDMDYFKACLDKEDYKGLDAVLIHVNRLILYIKQMKKIVIGVVHGHANGGGANLALATDYIIAEDNAVFTQSFTNIGLAPDAGAMYLLSKAVGSRRAYEICLSARPVKSEEAMAIGMINEVVPSGSGLTRGKELAEYISNQKLLAAELAKEQNRRINFADFEEYLFGAEKETVGESFRSKEFERSVNSFIERHKNK